MEHIGIDVHKNESQICRLTEDGEIIEKRVATRHDRFAVVLGSLPRARILIEASTESEWVARCLEGLGHEVIVADPNFAPMYASRTRRVKTDKRDAQALHDGCLVDSRSECLKVVDRFRTAGPRPRHNESCAGSDQNRPTVTLLGVPPAL